MAGVLFLAFCLIYGLSHDRIFYFDAVLFAGVVEQPLASLPAQVKYEWNHFLWYPTARAFYTFLHTIGLKARGYEILQWFNTLVGSLGVALVFLLLRRVASPFWALVWALMAAFSQVWWYRSGGGENHLFGTFWIIPLAWSFLTYSQKPSVGTLIQIGVFTTLSSYYHTGNFAAWGATFLFILFQNRNPQRWPHLFLVTIILAIGVFPYALVHHLFEPGGLSRWWMWATSLSHGTVPVSSTDKVGNISLSFFSNLGISLKTLIKSILFYEKLNYRVWGIIALMTFLGFLGIFYGRIKAKERLFPLAFDAQVSKAFGIPFLLFLGLYTFWMPGNYMYWAMHGVLLFLLIGSLSSRWQSGPIPLFQKMALGSMIFLLFQHNLSALIWPQRQGFPHVWSDVEASKTIGKLTPQQSPILISGAHRGNYKPFIPYFANRNRLSLDLFVINYFGKDQSPTQVMSQAIVYYLSRGIPVYVTGDLLNSAQSFSQWNLSPQAIESIWAPFRLLYVQRLPSLPSFKDGLYLVWTPQLPENAKDAIGRLLLEQRLYNQALLVYKERMRERPSEDLKKIIQNIRAEKQRKKSG